MINGKHSKTSRVLLLALSLLLVCCAAVGGTLAWLAASSATVTNTFTTGDIGLGLSHSSRSLGSSAPMIPGISINNNPLITVSAGSEKCWLFVRVEPSDNFDRYLSYDIQDEWTALPDVPNVYYREVPASNEDQLIGVLKNKCVTVRTDISNSDMHALTEDKYPTLGFTAYAVQYMSGSESHFTAAEAWTLISGNT